MTLTPQQRLEAYEWASEQIREEIGSQFICMQLSEWLDTELGIVTMKSKEVLSYFPEFLAQKPEHIIDLDGRWFKDHGGYYQRLAALDREIELVKEKI